MLEQFEPTEAEVSAILTRSQEEPILKQIKDDNDETIDTSTDIILSPTKLINSQALEVTTQENWSSATQELLDDLPRVWTRGLLYFLVGFVTIALPWAMLSKVDVTGTARGRLEPQGKTLTIDAPVPGTVAAILVKEGEVVKVGQPLLELDAELVSTELEQQRSQLEGQKNRLHQLKLLHNQLLLSFHTQQQQNTAQILEKQAQVKQAKQNLESLKKSFQFQKQETLAQVNQAEQTVKNNQTTYQFSEIRLANIQKEVERYQTALDKGIVAEIQVEEKVDLAKERERLYENAKSEIAQSELLLAEQKNRYEQVIRRALSEIEQAELRLKEQEQSYQSLIHSGKLALFKNQEQKKNVEREITQLKAEISQTRSQIKSLQFQLSQRVIKAPSEGIVFQLPINGKGKVLQPGDLIAEIAPKRSNQILRGHMATPESGSLTIGMAVKIKFDAYPFQDYGVIEGKLTGISPTSKLQENNQGQIANYDLEIELDQTCMPAPTDCIKFRPGDTATAEVIVRQRRVIDFIIDPFKKLQKEGLKL